MLKKANSNVTQRSLCREWPEAELKRLHRNIDALSCPKLTRSVAAPSARASPVRWSGRGGEGLAATSARGTMEKRRKVVIDAVAADCSLNPVRFAYPHQPIRKQLRSVRAHWEEEGNGEQGGLEEMAIRPKELCRIMRKPRP